MSIFKTIENQVLEAFHKAGYEVETIIFVKSARSDLGDYQINDCMALSKKYGKNPREIADEVVEILRESPNFTNLNVAGPGFINLSFTESFFLTLLKEMQKDLFSNVDLEPKKKVILDFGGANAAKALHVGHMRSANIGEALRRLAIFLGQEVISDVHLGDMGRQAGMVISELKREQPNLPWFDDAYQGEYPSVPLTNEDLGRLYPKASIAAKESEARLEEVRDITASIDKGDPVLTDLWKKIVAISSEGIKKTYDRLSSHFDLWEGEMDACQYKEQVLSIFNDYLYESEGALVIDVSRTDDKKELSPLIVVKSDGATIYATRDLGSLYSRMVRFTPDEVWYVTDERQSLYFEQVFRASYKTGLVPENVKLRHFGFGTINGKDGRPFKTRDGGVMQLEDLLDLVKVEVESRIREDILGEERENIAEALTIATIKYADLLPVRTTDYIFDVSKFSDLEGKTGPYILYSTIRMKSLLNKAKEAGISDFAALAFSENTSSERAVLLEIFQLANTLKKAYLDKSLNEICEYLFRLTSAYNKFYAENRILIEENASKQKTWLTLTEVVFQINQTLLDILAIDVPEKM